MRSTGPSGRSHLRSAAVGRVAPFTTVMSGWFRQTRSRVAVAIASSGQPSIRSTPGMRLRRLSGERPSKRAVRVGATERNDVERSPGRASTTSTFGPSGSCAHHRSTRRRCTGGPLRSAPWQRNLISGPSRRCTDSTPAVPAVSARWRLIRSRSSSEAVRSARVPRRGRRSVGPWPSSSGRRVGPS